MNALNNLYIIGIMIPIIIGVLSPRIHNILRKDDRKVVYLFALFSFTGGLFARSLIPILANPLQAIDLGDWIGLTAFVITLILWIVATIILGMAIYDAIRSAHTLNQQNVSLDDVESPTDAITDEVVEQNTLPFDRKKKSSQPTKKQKEKIIKAAQKRPQNIVNISDYSGRKGKK